MGRQLANLSHPHSALAGPYNSTPCRNGALAAIFVLSIQGFHPACLQTGRDLLGEAPSQTHLRLDDGAPAHVNPAAGCARGKLSIKTQATILTQGSFPAAAWSARHKALSSRTRFQSISS
jgi:hypothetical protein